MYSHLPHNYLFADQFFLSTGKIVAQQALYPEDLNTQRTNNNILKMNWFAIEAESNRKQKRIQVQCKCWTLINRMTFSKVWKVNCDMILRQITCFENSIVLAQGSTQYRSWIVHNLIVLSGIEAAARGNF